MLLTVGRPWNQRRGSVHTVGCGVSNTMCSHCALNQQSTASTWQVHPTHRDLKSSRSHDNLFFIIIIKTEQLKIYEASILNYLNINQYKTWQGINIFKLENLGLYNRFRNGICLQGITLRTTAVPKLVELPELSQARLSSLQFDFSLLCAIRSMSAVWKF